MFLLVALATAGSSASSQTLHSENQNPRNLADQYLQKLETITTKEHRNKAIIACLREIGEILETKASKHDVQTQLSATLDILMRSIDSRDKDMKRRFQFVQHDIDSLENATKSTINSVSSELHEIIHKLRSEPLTALSLVVDDTVSDAESAAVKLAERISSGAETSDSVSNTVVYFALSQILVVVFFLIVSKYQLLQQHCL